MGLFSGITKALGGAFDAVKSVFSPTDLVTSGLDFLGGQLTNSANAANAAATNTMSIELANTAHQREVRDLIAAGLNPILTAGGKGAVTPTLATPDVGNSLGQAINSARASSANSATVQNIQASTDKTRADAATARTQAALNLANIQKAKADIGYTNSATANNVINSGLLRAKGNEANLKSDLYSVPAKAVRYVTSGAAQRDSSAADARSPYAAGARRLYSAVHDLFTSAGSSNSATANAHP